MIHEITDLAALESNVLLRRTQVQKMETTMGIRCVFDYPKADITRMKLELQAIDWQELFGTIPTEDSWSAFKHKTQEIEARYVLMKAVHSHKLKLMWMSHNALKAVKHRHKIYRKYKDNRHPACKKADRLASAAVKKSRRHFEHRLA